MRFTANDLVMLSALVVFMAGGIWVLFAILRSYVKNFEKPSAIPLFVLSISFYITAAILLGHYLPFWLPVN